MLAGIMLRSLIRLIPPFLFVLALAGCQSVKDEFGLPEEDTAYLEVYLEGNPMSSTVGTLTMELPISGSAVQVFERPVMFTDDFRRAEVVEVRTYGKAIRLFTDTHGQYSLMRLSGDNIGYRLVFVINGQPMGARRIDGMLNDGVLYTFLEVADEDLLELVRKLNRTIGYAQSQGF